MRPHLPYLHRLRHGKEIPERDLPHIFERFFREEEPLSKRVTETGLRLLIVREIVQLHKGRVTVERKAGVGTTFTIWLPLVAQSKVGGDRAFS